MGAIERGDVIYTSAIEQQVLHALIQVLFTLNREYFPGEKKLANALAKLPLAPSDFALRVETVLCPGARPSVAELGEQMRGLAYLVREARKMIAHG